MDSITTIQQEGEDQTPYVMTSIRFEREFWRRVKVAAAERDISIQALCGAALEKYLSELPVVPRQE